MMLNQIPVAFGAGFFLQYFLPALAVAFAVAPLHPAWAQASRLDAFAFLVVALATIFMLFSSLTAQLVLGGVMPGRYKRRAQARLQRLLEKAQAHGHQHRVQQFPLDTEGKPYVPAPTLYASVFAAHLQRIAKAVGGKTPEEILIRIVRSYYLLDTELRKELEVGAAYHQATLLGALGLGAVALVYDTLFIFHAVRATLSGYCALLPICSVAAAAPYLAGAIGCALLAHLAYAASLVNLNSLVVAYLAAMGQDGGT